MCFLSLAEKNIYNALYWTEIQKMLEKIEGLQTRPKHDTKLFVVWTGSTAVLDVKLLSLLD